MSLFISSILLPCFYIILLDTLSFEDELRLRREILLLTACPICLSFLISDTLLWDLTEALDLVRYRWIPCGGILLEGELKQFWRVLSFCLLVFLEGVYFTGLHCTILTVYELSSVSFSSIPSLHLLYLFINFDYCLRVGFGVEGTSFFDLRRLGLVFLSFARFVSIFYGDLMEIEG